MLIPRLDDLASLRAALARSPIVLLTGPRQSGKSTLARQLLDVPAENHFDLERPDDLARLGEPMLSLSRLTGPVVIDEAQHRRDLFPTLRVLVDEDRRPGRFLILGSASPDLVGLSAETLAGRVTLHEIGGFRVRDLGSDALDELWERGGLPPAFIAANIEGSVAWRYDYVDTFLRRDLGDLGFRLPATTMRRFWTMLAHYHGQTWNASELARSLDTPARDVRRYLDALTDALVVRQLQPWFANVAKRQVKSPKVYVRDSGLLHVLLGIRSRTELLANPRVGASWEGFVIEQVLASQHHLDPWFWATHAGAEIDLVVRVGPRRIGVEIKRTATPSVTPSVRAALTDLELDHVVYVHAGPHTFPLSERVTAAAVTDVLINGLESTIGPDGSASSPA